MATIQKITSCLWFDGQAEEAANFYISIFKKMGRLTALAIMAKKDKKSMDKNPVRC